MSYNIKVDGSFEFNEKSISPKVLGKEGEWYILLIDGVKTKARLDHIDHELKTMTIRASGHTYEVKIESDLDQLVEKMGLSNYESGSMGDVVAPMPGKVLEIKINVGDEVQEGTPLMILEAMKMENILVAEGAGKVQAIQVAEGDTVDKNQLLVEVI